MTGPGSLQDAGDRIEELLDQLGSLPDRRARQWAEELVRLVLDLYGAGLERAAELGCTPGAPGGPELLERLAGDELVRASSSSTTSTPQPPGQGRAALAGLGGPSEAVTSACSSSTRGRAWCLRLLAPEGTAPQAMEDRVPSGGSWHRRRRRSFGSRWTGRGAIDTGAAPPGGSPTGAGV